MNKYLLYLLTLGSVSSHAQVTIPVLVPGPPIQQVRAYLALTDAQLTSLIQNLSDYSRLVGQRQQRILQVQSEIRDETAKSPLDPAALGIRYAEIEAICRNVSYEANMLQIHNLALLTDAQKTKLQTLDDAYKLLPIINEARNAGILSPPGPYVGTSTIAGFLLGTPSLSGCQQPSIRNGDFSATTGASIP
jgi:hypothetical protein